MFRSILDGVRDHPTIDPTRGEELRAASSRPCSATSPRPSRRSATWPGPRAPTRRRDASEEVADRRAGRAARGPGPDRRPAADRHRYRATNGWELSEPVLADGRTGAARPGHQRARRDAVRRPGSPMRVDPFEMVKSAHHLFHAPHRPGGPDTAVTAAGRRPAGQPTGRDRGIGPDPTGGRSRPSRPARTGCRSAAGGHRSAARRRSTPRSCRPSAGRPAARSTDPPAGRDAAGRRSSSMTRPLIGITTYREPATWGRWHGSTPRCCPPPTPTRSAAAGGTPLLIPPLGIGDQRVRDRRAGSTGW